MNQKSPTESIATLLRNGNTESDWLVNVTVRFTGVERELKARFSLVRHEGGYEA